MYRSSWQDADPLEEELQEGQVRVQAEVLNVAGSYQQIKAKGKLMMAAYLKPSALTQGSAGQKPK